LEIENRPFGCFGRFDKLRDCVKLTAGKLRDCVKLTGGNSKQPRPDGAKLSPSLRNKREGGSGAGNITERCAHRLDVSYPIHRRGSTSPTIAGTLFGEEPKML